MKKIFFAVALVLVFTGSCFAQEIVFVGNWAVMIHTSALDGSKELVAMQFTEDHKGTFGVSYDGRIITAMFVGSDYLGMNNIATMRYSIDYGPVKSTSVNMSNTAAKVMNISFIEELFFHDRLVVAITSYRGVTKEYIYTITGLAEAVTYMASHF